MQTTTQMANVEYTEFDSAHAALESLNADSVPFYRVATQKLKHLGIALSTLDKSNPPGGSYVPAYGHTMLDLMTELFNKVRSKVNLTNKPWKAIKVKGSNDVCFFSDGYAFDKKMADDLKLACDNVGLEIKIFQRKYPACNYQVATQIPKRMRMYNQGYDTVHRGKLIGFVLGAYANPHGTGTRKKRRRVWAVTKPKYWNLSLFVHGISSPPPRGGLCSRINVNSIMKNRL